MAGLLGLLLQFKCEKRQVRMTLEERITEAIKRHAAKFGTAATACYINPADAPADMDGTIEVCGILVTAKRSTLKDHIFIFRETQ